MGRSQGVRESCRLLPQSQQEQCRQRQDYGNSLVIISIFFNCWPFLFTPAVSERRSKSAEMLKTIDLENARGEETFPDKFLGFEFF